MSEKRLRLLQEALQPFVDNTAPAGKSVQSSNGDMGQSLVFDVAGVWYEAILLDCSFKGSMADQQTLAKTFKCTLSTRQQHLQVLKALLSKEANGDANDAEKEMLTIYRTKCVRDNQAPLSFSGTDIVEHARVWNDYGDPNVGALFVRPYIPIETIG